MDVVDDALVAGPQELLLAFQFIGQGAGAVELAQAFDHAGRVHRDRPVLVPS
jgi:hypothetical protein